MTPFEAYLLKTADILDEIGLDFMLESSNLLGAIREGRALTWDHEVNFAVLGKDITDKIIKEFNRIFALVEIVAAREKYGGIYLKTYMGEQENNKTFLIPIWLKNGICYRNMGGNWINVYPFDITDKTKWETTYFLGRKFNIPPKPIQVMVAYFGEDWQVVKHHWSWQLYSKNLKDYDEVFKT